MPHAPLVSIIVPTFNRPELLLTALNSAIHQTYSNLEIIVVNDAGKDVKDVIDSLHDKRLVYIQHEKNLGLPSTRNTALKQAKGKYVAYLDDDDLFYPFHIKKLVTALEGSNRKTVYSDFYYAYKRQEDRKLITYKKEKGYLEVELPSLLIDNHLPPVTVLHSKSCLDDVGYFDSTLKRHEDWDLWIRLAAKYPFLHFQEATAEYSYFDKTSSIQQTLNMWTGHFLNTMQRIHPRYKDLALLYSNISEEQIEAREVLRRRAFEQLAEMSNEELEKIASEKILLEIVDGALLNEHQDIKGAWAIVGYFTERLPKHPQLWLLFARLSRLVGDLRLADFATHKAQLLEENLGLLRVDSPAEQKKTAKKS